MKMIEWDELSIQTLAVVGRWNDIIEMCENYLRTNPPSAGEQTSESHVRVRICLITALTRINAYEKALNVAEKAIGVYSSNVRDAYVDPSVPFTLKFQHACLPMYLNEDITDKKNPSSAQKKKSKAIQIQNAGVSVLRLYSLQSWCQECHSKEEPLSDLWTLIQERCLRIQSALVEALHFNSSITQSLDMARTLCSATKVVDESTGPSAGEYTSVINREAQTRLLCMHYQYGLGDELKKNLLDNLPSRPECDEHTMKYYRSFQEALLNFHKGLYLAALDGFAFICSTFPGDIAAVNNYAICMVYSALTEKSQNLKSAMQHLESLLKSDTDTFAHPMIVTNLITMYEYAFEEGMLSTKIKSLQDLLRTKGYHPATMKSFLHGRYY